jgi:hypothetical protein
MMMLTVMMMMVMLTVMIMMIMIGVDEYDDEYDD